jgi:uncharacterized damage-inducible protein DinB
MISPEFCLTMARYNAWQNRQTRSAMERLTDAALREERGAFFGSILGTANHLLWGDLIWMARFDGGEVPPGGIKESPDLHPTMATWGAERFRTDGRILQWAEKLKALDMTGDLTWFSGAQGKDVSRPMATCITHFFNHQTHHRGQIHAMLTAAGENTGDTDLVFMPEDGPWL